MSFSALVDGRQLLPKRLVKLSYDFVVSAHLAASLRRRSAARDPQSYPRFASSCVRLEFGASGVSEARALHCSAG
jgi:hypothetical protein